MNHIGVLIYNTYIQYIYVAYLSTSLSDEILFKYNGSLFDSMRGTSWIKSKLL